MYLTPHNPGPIFGLAEPNKSAVVGAVPAAHSRGLAEANKSALQTDAKLSFAPGGRPRWLDQATVMETEKAGHGLFPVELGGLRLYRRVAENTA